MMPRNVRMALCSCVVLAGPLLAQEGDLDQQCGTQVFEAPGGINTSVLGAAKGDVIFGGGGQDTIKYGGPTFLVVGRDRGGSFERLDLQNGQFDTVVVSGEFVRSAEDSEIDLRLDAFDTVVLDPRLQWQQSPDPSQAFNAHRAEIEGKDLTVLLPLGTFVLTQETTKSVTTAEGPEGGLLWPVRPNTQEPELSSISETKVRLVWKDKGAVQPTTRGLAVEVAEVDLDFRNGVVNVIELALGNLMDKPARSVRLYADPFDQLVVKDIDCWTVQEHSQPELARLGADLEDGFSARVEMTDALLFNGAKGALSLGVANKPGVWHLSADTVRVLDAIDLRNAGKDTLILRNDGRLRNGQRWIMGDPGDEIWLDGAGGWTVDTDERGTIASVPTGQRGGSKITLQFAPGLVLRLLPMPPFLNEPALLEQPFYPGLPDKITDSGGMLVTRGGFVDMSVNQFANRRELDLTNGSPNTLRIRPEDFTLAGLHVALKGDAVIDTVLTIDMPKPKIRADGNVVWTLPHAGGEQVIMAYGLNVIDGSGVNAP